MNERFTVFFAILAAEVGAAALSLLAGHLLPGGPFASSGNEMLLLDFGIITGFWAMIFGGTWVLWPRLWRVRQQLRSKLKVLGWVCGVALVADNAAILYLAGNPDAQLAGWMGFRSVGLLVGFWLAVWVHAGVDQRRARLEHRPMKFGRE